MNARNIARLMGALVIVAAVASGATAAATTTTVSVSPADASVSADGQTTVDIVVESAADGVGAYNLTVSLADPSVARITDIALPSDPAVEETTRVGDDAVRVRVVGLDTPNTGEATIASVTVEATADSGTTDVDVSVAALGDEAGNSYTVSGTDAGQLTIGSTSQPTTAPTTEPPSSGGGSGGDDGGGGGGSDGDNGDNSGAPVATTDDGSEQPSSPATTTTTTADSTSAQPTVTATATTAESPSTATEASTSTAARATQATSTDEAATTAARARGEIPGFTPLTAVAALAAVVVLARLRSS